MSSNAPGQPDQAGDQSGLNSNETALAEHIRREEEMNRQSEPLGHPLARFVQERDPEVPRSQPENSFWSEESLGDSTSWEEYIENLENLWFERATRRVPRTHGGRFFDAENAPGQTSGITRVEPMDPAEIMRRAERAVHAEIQRRLREPTRGPVHRARAVAGVVSRMARSRNPTRRIVISQRELQFFAMLREVERLQEEIDFIHAGGGNGI